MSETGSGILGSNEWTRGELQSAEGLTPALRRRTIGDMKPIVKGGQGRTASSLVTEAKSFAYLMTLGVVGFVVILVAWLV